jgi:nucleoside-diphosphate-sugar epimerase
MDSINLDFRKKTILITGGAGFIGSNLAHYIQNNFEDIYIHHLFLPINNQPLQVTSMIPLVLVYL